VTGVRAALATTVLAIGAIVSFATPAVAAGGPSGAQIRTAVQRAESSKALWATINICNSRRYKDSVGVRGQMPTLGFPANLSMRIQTESWAPKTKRFVPITFSTAVRTVSLGQWSKNLQQAGAVFPFDPHSGLLSATVTFTWTRNRTVLGHVTKPVTAGHRDADYASPPHYSAAQCRIP
jgi:hypothetical protein